MSDGVKDYFSFLRVSKHRFRNFRKGVSGKVSIERWCFLLGMSLGEPVL